MFLGFVQNKCHQFAELIELEKHKSLAFVQLVGADSRWGWGNLSQ